MKLLALGTSVIVLALIGAGVAAATADAATLCVGGPTCFTTIQDAVDAAQAGDTITIASGTYAGGITIDVSVDVRGAGAGATVIQGGGPVLKIGLEQAATEPSVSISGVTITGGLNSSSPGPPVTQGGGVEIPQGAFPARVGATVTISDSVVTGNTVASQQLLPPGFCGPFDCSFASGGGIFNDGTLTLINTRVTDNQAGAPGSVTTNAGAGGIATTGPGELTLKHSFVTGNRALAATPWGGGASSGGIQAFSDVMIEDSIVSGNSVDVSSALEGDFELHNAIAGGITIGAQATIARTTVRGNTVTASYVSGVALAVSGGIQDDGTLRLTDSTVAQNQVSANVPPSSGGTAIAAQGGLGVGGVATLERSVVSGNSVAAESATGAATAGGAGIGNFGQLALQKTLVIGNTGTAHGATGNAQGGGINNFTLGGPDPQLTLTDSVVTANRLSASPGIAPQGGGLFTSFPVTLTRTVIAGNKPDQCFGC